MSYKTHTKIYLHQNTQKISTSKRNIKLAFARNSKGVTELDTWQKAYLYEKRRLWVVVNHFLLCRLDDASCKERE